MLQPVSCPQCRTPMAPTSEEGMRTEFCIECGWVWLRADQLDRLRTNEQPPPDLNCVIEPNPEAAEWICPQCPEGQFMEVLINDQRLYACDQCQGILVASDALDRLLPDAPQTLMGTMSSWAWLLGSWPLLIGLIGWVMRLTHG